MHLIINMHLSSTSKTKKFYFNLSKRQNRLSYIVNVVTTIVCLRKRNFP